MFVSEEQQEQELKEHTFCDADEKLYLRDIEN